MTTVAICQPHYLPWLGYLDLIDQADRFVILDNVAVSKQSWQTRNKVRARDGSVVWLSIPTHAHMDQPLNEVKIAHDNGWRAKHWRTLESAYGHAPFWGTITAWPRPYDFAWRNLTDFTTATIYALTGLLGIRTKIVRASQLARQRHGRIERLADILQSTGATEYLANQGAAYLHELSDIDGVPIRAHEFVHPRYDQGGAEFMPYLSVVDLLAWHGPASLDIIRSGRRLVTKTGNG